MKNSLKLVLLLVLSAACLSERLRLATFDVIYPNQSGQEEEVSLSFDDIYVEYQKNESGHTFQYVRPHHSRGDAKESQDIKAVLAQFFDNVEADDKTLTLKFESSDITGTDMIRRGEFGDVYVLIVKSSKITEARFNIMTKKGDKNADDFYNVITHYFPQRFLN